MGCFSAVANVPARGTAVEWGVSCWIAGIFDYLDF